jgi:HD-like signal output (HDOD) protein
MESLTAGWEQVEIDPQPLAALHVLRVVAEPRASSADLAHLIEADPTLAARPVWMAGGHGVPTELLRGTA